MAEKNKTRNILISSSESDFLSGFSAFLKEKGCNTVTAESNSDAMRISDSNNIDAAVLDLSESQPQEIDPVSYIKKNSANTEIIVIAGLNEIDRATLSLRNGASFYLIKPVSHTDLYEALKKLLKRLSNGREQLEIEQRFLHDLMGTSSIMQKNLKFAMKIAPTSSNVLIGGATGTGKEFFARIIHRMSQRLEGDFIPVNCGAVPENLFESEMFGHKKGSFTGADRDKAGLVEQAHMGTLFLDEIGELSPRSQVKLLRFIQERNFRRIGETHLRNVNVRIIAASNKNLKSRVTEGKFREDLFYRLNIFYLHLPPLKDRKETIPNLVRLFIHKNNNITGKNITSLTKEAETMLINYSYPGNIRELENIIEHAVVLAEGSVITENDLPEFMRPKRPLLEAPKNNSAINLNDIDYSGNEIIPLDQIEKREINRALSILDHNYSETAERLGISRSTLWRKMKNYGIKTLKNRKK